MCVFMYVWRLGQVRFEDVCMYVCMYVCSYTLVSASTLAPLSRSNSTTAK